MNECVYCAVKTNQSVSLREALWSATAKLPPFDECDLLAI